MEEIPRIKPHLYVVLPAKLDVELNVSTFKMIESIVGHVERSAILDSSATRGSVHSHAKPDLPTVQTDALIYKVTKAIVARVENNAVQTSDVLKESVRLRSRHVLQIKHDALADVFNSNWIQTIVEPATKNVSLDSSATKVHVLSSVKTARPTAMEHVPIFKPTVNTVAYVVMLAVRESSAHKVYVALHSVQSRMSNAKENVRIFKQTVNTVEHVEKLVSLDTSVKKERVC